VAVSGETKKNLSFVLRGMAFELICGLGLGYGYSRSLRDEIEVKQGENDYYGAMYQTKSLQSVSCVASKVLQLLPSTVPGLGLFKFGNFCLPAAGMVALPAATLVKKGHYNTSYKILAQCVPQVENILPQEISETSQSMWTFLADNARTGMQVGMGAAIVAFPFFGLGSLSAGLVLPMVYGKLEEQGYVPVEVAAAVEKIGPTVNNVGLMMTGPLGQLCAGTALATHIPGANQLLHQTLERRLREKTYMPGYSLEQYDRPWLTDIVLSRTDILDIVSGRLRDFNVNPAHFGKETKSFKTLNSSTDYSTLLLFANQIDWDKNYKPLRSKFKKDERLLKAIGFIYKPNLDCRSLPICKGCHQCDEDFLFDQCVEAQLGAATKSPQCKELLVLQFRTQLQAFVEVISGLRPHIGSASDLLVARQNTQYILPYVKKLGPANVSTIDILFALGIEGGEYCALGLKFVTSNIVEEIQSREREFKDQVNDNDPDSDEQRYKTKVFSSLQTMRDAMVATMYQRMVEGIAKVAKAQDAGQKILLDVHTVVFYRKILTLGFSVLTQEERDALTLAELYNWFTLSPLREYLTKLYEDRLHEAIEEHKVFYLFEFLQNKLARLRETQVLSEVDIEYIETVMGEINFTQQRAGNLFFCLTGVLFPKRSITDDYDAIEPPQNEKEDEDGCIMIDY
jgi:hypothetical protein